MLISTQQGYSDGDSNASFNPSTGLMLISTLWLAEQPDQALFQSLDWVDVDFDAAIGAGTLSRLTVSIPRLG